MSPRFKRPSCVQDATRPLRLVSLMALVVVVLVPATPVHAEDVSGVQLGMAAVSTAHMEAGTAGMAVAMNGSIDLINASAPHAAVRGRPPMAAVRGEFPTASAETTTGAVRVTPSGRSGPLVLFGGLGVVLVLGLTALAGINSRKRWPSITDIRSS